MRDGRECPRFFATIKGCAFWAHQGLSEQDHQVFDPIQGLPCCHCAGALFFQVGGHQHGPCRVHMKDRCWSFLSYASQSHHVLGLTRKLSKSKCCGLEGHFPISGGHHHGVSTVKWRRRPPHCEGTGQRKQFLWSFATERNLCLKRRLAPSAKNCERVQDNRHLARGPLVPNAVRTVFTSPSPTTRDALRKTIFIGAFGHSSANISTRRSTWQSSDEKQLCRWLVSECKFVCS